MGDLLNSRGQPELRDPLQWHKPLGTCFIENAKATLTDRQGEAENMVMAKKHLASLVEFSGSASASASSITDAFCMSMHAMLQYASLYFVCGLSLVSVLSIDISGMFASRCKMVQDSRGCPCLQ